MRVYKDDKYLHEKHKSTCKGVKYLVKQCIIDFELNLAKDSKHNPKWLYSYINRKCGNRESISVIQNKSGHLITEKAEICTEYNHPYSLYTTITTPTTKNHQNHNSLI